MFNGRIILQSVRQYCLHFYFVNFSASKAPRSSILDIFQQPFPCRFAVKIEFKLSFSLASLVILIWLVNWVSVPNFSSLVAVEVTRLIRKVLNTKLFCRDISGLNYGKTIVIFYLFLVYFYICSNLKGKKYLNNKNFGNSFGTLVTQISKLPGISKIYPPLADNRMLCMRRNNLFVFDSCQRYLAQIV